MGAGGGGVTTEQPREVIPPGLKHGNLTFKFNESILENKVIEGLVQ